MDGPDSGIENIRVMRFEELLGRHERDNLTQDEVVEMLGGVAVDLRRWRERYRVAGEAGLHDRRLGQLSPRSASPSEIRRMVDLYSAD